MVGLTIVVIALSIALLVLVALFLRQRRRIRKLAEQAEDFLVGNGAPLEFSVQEDSLAPLQMLLPSFKTVCCWQRSGRQRNAAAPVT